VYLRTAAHKSTSPSKPSCFAYLYMADKHYKQWLADFPQSSSSSDSDSDDEEEDESLIEIAAALIILEANLRIGKWSHDRQLAAWDKYVAKLEHANEFEVTFRMEHTTFCLLVDILREALTVDAGRSVAGGEGSEPIFPEIIAAMGLRWLAGGAWQDIKQVFDVSRASFYRCKDLFLVAVIECPRLDIYFPKTKDELDEQASRFESISHHGLIRGCIGAIDEILIRTVKPAGKKATDYFSGHYKWYGMNVQAVCDERGRFLYICTALPGSQPDANAFDVTSLKHWVNNLPPGYFLVGDNAHVLSEHMLIPFFSGSQRSYPLNSVFNYFLSQLRIRIEMAFGLLSTKWRIFHRAMEIQPEGTKQVVMACARLHNFIIDNEWEDPYVAGGGYGR
jgi:hypothetical protein